MARVLYRVGQFWRGLRATVTPQEQRRVAALLPAAALRLFTQMPMDAQRHSLNVWVSLEAAGHHDPDLAVAALLHDCGKVAAAQGGVALGLWLRGPLVVLDAFFPRILSRWATAMPPKPGSLPWQGWRYALYVQREHPAIGAAWAAEAGCSPLSCWLIANHQTRLAAIPPSAASSDEALRLLRALQQADSGN